MVANCRPHASIDASLPHRAAGNVFFIMGNKKEHRRTFI